MGAMLGLGAILPSQTVSREPMGLDLHLRATIHDVLLKQEIFELLRFEKEQIAVVPGAKLLLIVS
jgi:hypothetical protein